MSILGKAWCELWHSSHNDILTPMSWCVSSGYFKNHWGLKLFLKCHRRSQNVYFFYLGGPILLLNIQVYSLEGVARRCSVKKTFFANFTKFTGKHLCQSLFFCQGLQLWHKCFPVNFVKFLRTLFLTKHLWQPPNF